MKSLLFLALPFGFGAAVRIFDWFGTTVRIFTKVVEVPFKVLRGVGNVSVVYKDDSEA